MNNAQNTNKRKDGLLAKIFKVFLICFAGITLAIGVFYYVTSKSMEFNFANEGQLICTNKRDWGFLSGNDLHCFGIVPIVNGVLPTSIPEKISPSGEIILTK